MHPRGEKVQLIDHAAHIRTLQKNKVEWTRKSKRKKGEEILGESYISCLPNTSNKLGAKNVKRKNDLFPRTEQNKLDLVFKNIEEDRRAANNLKSHYAKFPTWNWKVHAFTCITWQWHMGPHGTQFTTYLVTYL